MWKGRFNGVTTLFSMGRWLIWPGMMGGDKEGEESRCSPGCRKAGAGRESCGGAGSRVRVAGETRPGAECASVGAGYQL